MSNNLIVGRLKSVDDFNAQNYPISVVFKELKFGAATVGSDFNVDPSGDTKLTLKDATLKARKLRGSGNVEAYSVIKRELPAYIFAGSCSGRSVDKYSGLVVLDFDDLNGDVEDAIEMIQSIPETFACWRTLSGEKCIALVKVDPIPTFETYKYAWFAAYNRYSLICKADKGFRRPSQTATGAWDENLYFNENSVSLKWEVEEEAYKSEFPSIKAEDALLSTLEDEYVSAVEEMEWKENGWGVTQLPCMFETHEFDGWDSRENGMGVRKVSNGYLFSCLKCDKSKAFTKAEKHSDDLFDLKVNPRTGKPRLLLMTEQAVPKSSHEVVLEATDILKDANEKKLELFYRGAPVHIETKPSPDGRGTITEFKSCDIGTLSSYINECCDICKVKLAKGDGIDEIVPKALSTSQPPYISTDILNRNLISTFAPRIDRVVTHPILTDEGDLITDEGFYSAYNLYLKPNYDPSKIKLLDSVDEAKEKYLSLFKHFPFKDVASLGIAFSYPLTLLLRHLIDGLIPIYHSGASVQRSGKGLLFESQYRIVTGDELTKMNYPTTKYRGITVEHNNIDDLFERRFSDKLSRGFISWIIDNVPDSIEVDSPYLAQHATSWMLSAKILFVQNYLNVANYSILVLTGNNLEFSTDLLGRTVHCILEPDVAEPGKRDLPDIWSSIDSDRELYLSCLLTICSHALKSENSVKGLAFGSFQEWSDMMTLVFNGMDEKFSLETSKNTSTEKDVYTEFFKQVWKDFETDEWSPKQVIYIAYAEPDNEIDTPGDGNVPIAENVSFTDTDGDLYGYEFFNEVRPCYVFGRCAQYMGYVLKPLVDRVFDVADGVSVRFVKRQGYSVPKYYLERIT